jgi:hypothetical protein
MSSSKLEIPERITAGFRSEKSFLCRGVSGAGTAVECQAERADEFPGRGKSAIKGMTLSDSPPVSESVDFRHVSRTIEFTAPLRVDVSTSVASIDRPN